MYRFGRVLEERNDEIKIHAFRHERNERSADFSQSYEHRVKRCISRRLVFGHFAAPVSLSAAANAPVGKFVGEVLNGSCRFENLVIVQAFVNRLYKCVEFGQNPFIHKTQLAFFKVVFRRVIFIDVGV